MKATCKNCGYQWEKGTDSNHTKDDCIERLKAENHRLRDGTEFLISLYDELCSKVPKDLLIFTGHGLEQAMNGLMAISDNYNQTTEQGE